ncbi:hypothetical protein MYX65_06910 [Acidobacteria bacterium AH-259-L09]|nr:hypothetical protein [Acidobacteria bacterium AH-259-L09]
MEDSRGQHPVRPSWNDEDDRLDSWKEIATYLERTVATVKRWEKKEGCPVRRHVHDKQATVYAYRSEIDAWLTDRRPEQERNGPRQWFAAFNGKQKAVGGIAIGTAFVLLATPMWWTKSDQFAPNEPSPRPLTKFVITAPPTAPLARTSTIDLAISADGRRIVYVAGSKGRTQLFVRPLDEVDARPIPGTEGAASFPFFSPDGEWVGFFADGKLKKVSLMGGPPITICEAGSGWLGGAWNAQDTVVFSADRALYQVSAAGGKPESLATPDPEKGERGYYCPKFLPNGKALLFDVGVGNSPRQIRVLSLQTGEQKVVVQKGINAYYAPTGHLVYQQGRTGGPNRTLMAAPFDLGRLEVTGNSVPILEGIRRVDYALSVEGTLVYVPASRLRSGQYSLVWVDREGGERVVSRKDRKYLSPRISPDGKQIALTIFNEEETGYNIWIYDLEADFLRRLTWKGDTNARHAWTPDGKWITFVSNRDGPTNLYRKRADGSRPAERLVSFEGQFAVVDPRWSPDGSVLAFSNWVDIWFVPMDADRVPQPLITSPGAQRAPVFSADGQWLAYVSDETGGNHVYVRPYPEPDLRWLVSDEEGGGEPVWSPNGRELFYRSLSGGKMMAVRIETQPTFKAGKPRTLFDGPYFLKFPRRRDVQDYDISPDGQRFLMIKEEKSAPTQLNVVENWFEELKRLVPTG